MKKIFLITILFLLSSILTSAQTSEVFLADTLGNSKSLSTTIKVPAEIDSLTISLYSVGEIDIDSLDIKFGVIEAIKMGTGKTTYLNYFASSSSTYSKTLTVNLNDGVESYLSNVVTIPMSALKGYNVIKVTLIGASSGNDGKDVSQKAVLRKTTYK